MLRLSPPASLLGLSVLAVAALTGCNQGPTAPGITLMPDAPTTLDDIVAERTTEATDPNKNDVLSYAYTWEMRAPGAAEDAWNRVDDLNGNTVPSSRTVKGQSWRVQVTVSDGAETAAFESEASVTVQNSTPEIISVRVSPNQGVDTFGTLTASASASDIDGDEVEIEYTWYVNGTALDVDGSVLSGDHFAKGDSVHVEATPVDGESMGEPVASNAVVILNTPPKIDGVTITPEDIFEESAVKCEAVGWYDADGDTPTVTATWLVNGEVIEGVTGDLTGDYFGKDDLIRCMGAPTDGDSTGDVVVSQVVQVQNSGPTLGSVTLSHTDPTAADTVTFTPVDAVDPDGDTVRYTVEWYVDGELVSTENELAPRSFVRGQEVYAIVTPTDGELAGDPVTSATVTAANTPPDLTSVTLTPELAYTDSTLFPLVEAEDLDGDPVTYTVEWTVNGSVISETGSVLEGDTWFDKDDTVSVKVKPNDGIDDGPTLTSTTITVLNSAPTVPVIAMDPEKPKSDDDLWCAVDVESTDADGDELTYTFSWTRNGSEFTDTDTLDYEGDYVYTDFTADQDQFSCTLEVTDGTDTVETTITVDVLDWEGPREFTTCRKSGSSGPSQSNCDSAYGSTTLDGAVTVSSGIQAWTVPQDGTFTLEAFGAQGGKGRYGSYYGHRGARVRGDFDLSEGDTLYVLVGQEGQSEGGSYAAGGGGGTFVFLNGTSASDLILAAGGGGGNGYHYYYYSACGGQSGGTSTYASSGSSSSCYSHRSSGGGSYYSRYSGSTLYVYGGGGAGIDDYGDHFLSSYRAHAPTDSTYHGRGGTHPYAYGGFGGGGSGGYMYRYSWGSQYYSSSYGGGGGGYAGGGASYYRGGGGSSYNDGANQSNSSAVHNGAGKLTLDLAE